VSARPVALPRALGATATLWRFSRPHTIIGSALGVAGLFVIALDRIPGVEFAHAAFHGLCTLLAALLVNLFIVGVNQITDVEIDRINKPWLPIAAGELSPRAARNIVAGAAAIALALALSQGLLETAAVTIALAVGAAYSLEPLRLKRHALLAGASISLVRALVVNLGVYLHFELAFAGDPRVPPAVWALIAFTVPFSGAIAILKDVPDVEGDRRFSVLTFSVRFGPERMTRVALGLLTATYLAMAALGPLIDGASAPVWIAGHLGALALLGAWASRRTVFEAFYMRIWRLFFLEYLLVPLALLAT
jgi:homogentisate phytyltransferase/homogentisate geranylgeranyltransferase